MYFTSSSLSPILLAPLITVIIFTVVLVFAVFYRFLAHGCHLLLLWIMFPLTVILYPRSGFLNQHLAFDSQFWFFLQIWCNPELILNEPKTSNSQRTDKENIIRSHKIMFGLMGVLSNINLLLIKAVQMGSGSSADLEVVGWFLATKNNPTCTVLDSQRHHDINPVLAHIENKCLLFIFKTVSFLV